MKHLHADKQPNRHYSLGMERRKERSGWRGSVGAGGDEGVMGQRITPPTLPDSSLAVGMRSKVGGCPTLTPPQSPNPECVDVNMRAHTPAHAHTLRGTLPLIYRSEKNIVREREREVAEILNIFCLFVWLSESLCEGLLL